MLRSRQQDASSIPKGAEVMKRAGIAILMMSLAGIACGRVGGDSSDQDSDSHPTDTATDGVKDAVIDSGSTSDTAIDGLPPGCPATVPATTPPMECPGDMVGTECTYSCGRDSTIKYKCLKSGDFAYPIWYNNQPCLGKGP